MKWRYEFLNELLSVIRIGKLECDLDFLTSLSSYCSEKSGYWEILSRLYFTPGNEGDTVSVTYHNILCVTDMSRGF